MKKRIFVALLIPDNIKSAIGDWQKNYPTFDVGQFRWIKPENLHITLIPPWYASEEEIEQLVSYMIPVASNLKKFSIRLERVLFGPPGKMKRLIWTDGRTPKEFAELKKALENALAGFVRKENRPPLLHLTIARFQPVSENELPPLNEKVDWSFQANEIAIIESVLKRAGAEYRPLKIFKLG